MCQKDREHHYQLWYVHYPTIWIQLIMQQVHFLLLQRELNSVLNMKKMNHCYSQNYRVKFVHHRQIPKVKLLINLVRKNKTLNYDFVEILKSDCLH